MTGSWLILKWVGVAVLALYLVLILVAVWRYRAQLSRLRSELYLPMILGNFVSLSVPSVFESVAVTRVCFIVAHLIYAGGIVILLRGLAQKDEVLLKTES
jgi:hypothetical protein